MGGYGLWQIEHRGEFRLAPTSLPRGNKRDYVSLVRWRFACALRGSARGFWFIDPLGLRPRGLCTVATRACHVNHAPPSYNYNIHTQYYTFTYTHIIYSHTHTILYFHIHTQFYSHVYTVGPADESSHYKIMDENHPGKIDIHGWFLVVCDIIIAHDG